MLGAIIYIRAKIIFVEINFLLAPAEGFGLRLSLFFALRAKKKSLYAD